MTTITVDDNSVYKPCAVPHYYRLSMDPRPVARIWGRGVHFRAHAHECVRACARGVHIQVIYIYNSVLTRRHRHINFSASTPPNATKIYEMKVSHHGLEIVGPELLFSIYKMLFFGVCLREVETQSG